MKGGKAIKIGVAIILGLLIASFGIHFVQVGNPSSNGSSASTTSTTSFTCPPLLPGPSTASGIPQLNGTVNTPFILNSAALFPTAAGGVAYDWHQVFPSATELDYVTNFAATIVGSSQPTATVFANEPGNYRFALSSTMANGSVVTDRIDVQMTDPAVRKLAVTGVIFSDVFTDLGGPSFTMGPYPNPCQQERFQSALAGPASVGAGWVGYVPALFYTQVTPTPKFAAVNNDLSLSNDTYYYEMIAAAHSEGFKVLETLQAGGTSPDLSPDQAAALPAMMNSSTWWSAWYDGWQNATVAEAMRAQKAGVDMFSICLFCEGTFIPQVYPNYTQRWDDIVSAVRQVYTGKVVMDLIVADDRFTMYNKLDGVILTIFPGLYTTSGNIADVNSPTMGELVNQSKVFFAFTDWLAGKLPVYFAFAADSSVGQYNPDPPPWFPNPPPANQTSFREQAMYYEAFLSVMANQSWVSGIFTERWDYFDHFARTGQSSSSYYFDQTLGASPRNKPAEAVVKLWYGMFD